MQDRHLNLFYSYNRDSELIENNLTRALMVTLRMLGDEARNAFLQTFLAEGFQRLHPDQPVELPDFSAAQFSLQGYMDKRISRRMQHRYVLAIASHRYDEMHWEERMAGLEQDSLAIRDDLYGGSIPDGWIYDTQDEYCYLIEAKVGSYPLTRSQIYSHAREWLGWQSEDDIERHVLSLTWADVLYAIQEVRQTHAAGELDLNSQELAILTDLKDFIQFFGYTLFQGISFRELQSAPDFALVPGASLFQERRTLFNFSDLGHPPLFQIGHGP